MITYNVNEAKRTIVAVLQLEDGSQFIGKAKCSPDDKWNEEVGKEIARKRAVIAVTKSDIRYLEHLCNEVNEYYQKLQHRLYKNYDKLANIQYELAVSDFNYGE